MTDQLRVQMINIVDISLWLVRLDLAIIALMPEGLQPFEKLRRRPRISSRPYDLADPVAQRLSMA